MVRLRGMPRPVRGMGRPLPRLMRPEPAIPPFALPRGRLGRGIPPVPPRMGPPRSHLPPPRMAPPPPIPPPLPPRRLPLPPRPPMPPRDMLPPMVRRPLPPPPIPGRRPGMPPPPLPPMPPGPLLRRPIRPGPPFLRGRGGLMRRGVKRLGTTANGRPKKTQKRKEKTEGQFFCETCDRAWKTQDKLDAHIAEHEVCGRDGCTFTAHPKIVLKHVEVQHDSGLYHRIVFTKNLDDVAKWIAERKKNYPTKQNVNRKEAQAEEMNKRGERLPNQGKQFHQKEKRHTWKDRRKGRNHDFARTHEYKIQANLRSQRRNVVDVKDKWKDTESWRGDLPKFPGTVAFPDMDKESREKSIEEKHFSDDEEWKDKIVDEKQSIKPFVSNILASLMVNYGSDVTDDEISEDIPSKPLYNTARAVDILKTEQPLGTKTETIVQEEGGHHSFKTVENNIIDNSKISEDSDSGPEECGVDREDRTNIPVPKSNEKVAVENETKQIELCNAELPVISRPKPPPKAPMKRIQLSLLEKLLANEIRHERNVILQCVRYIVNNNFFGCGSKN